MVKFLILRKQLVIGTSRIETMTVAGLTHRNKIWVSDMPFHACGIANMGVKIISGVDAMHASY